jgi:hypothetical protein
MTDPNATPRDEDVQTDPRLIKVIDRRDLKESGTTLHRFDDEKGCSHRPDTNTRTDLVTAAVFDGHTLCSRCVWPDGAEEVLDG